MKKKALIKEITLDDLAMMTQRGFADAKEETQKGFREADKKIDDFKKEVHERFNIIENKLITQHTIEIEHLRDKVMQHEVKLAKLLK